MTSTKLLLLATLVLYITTPNKYNYPYCLLGMCLFSVFFYMTLKNAHFTIASFNVLFSLTFFGVTYLYPIFVYPVFPTFAFFSIGTINENIITKATIFATLSYSFYAYFYIHSLNKYPITSNVALCRIVNKGQIKKIVLALIIAYCVFISSGGLDMFKSDYSGQPITVNPLASFVYVLFISYTIFACIANRNINNKFLYLIVGLIAISILFTGSRTLPLRLLSILFVLLVDTYNISKKKIIMMLVVGGITMSLVGQNRSEGTIERGELGAVASAVDLIVCSRAYYEIYDYVNQYGITYGITSSANILSVIPYAQSVFSNLFGIPGNHMRSDSFVTDLVLGHTNSTLGLGTHISGDTYLAFGIVGTLTLFSFLGYYIVKWRYNSYQLGNWKSTVVYYTMISCAVFMTRSSFFLGLKDIVWVICFTYLYRKAMPTHKKVEKIN